MGRLHRTRRHEEPAVADDAVTASYWVHGLNPARFLWNCEACPAMGQEDDEPSVIHAMNAHVADEHPHADYVPTPIPDQKG